MGAAEESRRKAAEAELVVATCEAARIKAGGEAASAAAAAEELRLKAEEAERVAALVEAARIKAREEAAAAAASAAEARRKERETERAAAAAEAARVRADGEVGRQKEVIEHVAATSLQCAVRARSARKKSGELQHDREARLAKERDASVTLQCSLMVWAAKREVDELQRQRELAPTRTTFDLQAGVSTSYTFAWPSVATTVRSFHWNVKVRDELTIDLEIKALMHPICPGSGAQKIVVERHARGETFVGSFSPAKDRRLINGTTKRVDTILFSFSNSFSWMNGKEVEITTIFL